MKVKVDVLSDSKFPVSRKLIRERVAKVLVDREVEGSIYVSVAIVGDRKMRWMNQKYRNKDYTTDVLSFPTVDPSQKMDDRGFMFADGEIRVLGDILVSYPQAVMLASRLNQMVDQVVADLVEHGMLHLLGIHHD